MQLKWLRLIDLSFATRIRIIDEDLLDDVQYDLSAQYPTSTFVTEPMEKQLCLIDMPGPIFMGRNIQTIDIDGLSIQIPAQDYETIYNMLKLAPPQEMQGFIYYELNSPTAPCCIVLSAGQRDVLVRMMEDSLEACKILGELDDQEFADRVRILNQNIGHEFMNSSRAKAIDAANNGKKGSN